MAKQNKQQPTSRFVRSVHLELDHQNADALRDYLLTAGARRVLARFIPSLAEPAATKAWTLTGPYGTGKSAFTVFAAQLLAHKGFPGQAKARDILKHGDEDLFELLLSKSKQFKGLYPIAMTGSREPLSVAILRGLEVALSSADGRLKASLIRQIAKLRHATISGENVSDRDLLSVVTEATKILSEASDGPTGLFLIIDEFGKLLEYAASHPSRSDVYIAVLKAVGLLSVVGATRNLRATPDAMKFSLAGLLQASDVERTLKKLEKASVVVSREYSGSYALWEGSDVDIDERVKVARDRLDQTEPLAHIASRYIALRTFVARKHVFQTGTLRYFTTHFVAPNFLTAEIGKVGEADGRILVALPTNAEEQAMVRQVVESELARHIRVIVAVPSETRNLDLCVRELAGLEWVRENTPELAGDLTARRELRARVAELRGQLDTLTENILSPASQHSTGCNWFHNGKPVRTVTSKRALNDFISDCCRQVFPKTPRILNELVNRRELSSAAAAARRNLMEYMVTREESPNLGIEGFPPEKSIYLSVLAQTGIHSEQENGWEFGPPKTGADGGVKAAWQAMQSFFDSTERLA
jgi:hypothetical protein